MTRVMIATTVGALLLAGTAAAQTPQTPSKPATQTPEPSVQQVASAPFPADARIGFVNMQAVVSTSKLGKAGQEKMKELSDKRSADIAAKNKEVQTLQQQVQSGQSVLSATVLAQKNADLDKATREVQFMQQQAQADIQALNDQLLDEFSSKVLPIVEQIRGERNLWVVFSLGDGSGVAAVHPGLDLSAEVIKRLDAAEPASN